jgi:SulP family sulfate permease
LLFLTPLFAHIPKAALAALVISAVMQLFHPGQVLKIWKMNRHDGVVAVSVLVLALLTKPDYALFIGVAISLVLFIWKTMHPRIVRLSKDPELDVFTNADTAHKPGCPQVLMLRCDFAIYFANASYIVDHFLQSFEQHGSSVRYMIVDLEGVGFIDLTGVDELRRLKDELKQSECKLVLERVRAPVLQVFKSSGFLDEISPKNMFSRQLTALSHVLDNVDHTYCKDACSHALFVECERLKASSSGVG